MAKKYVCPKVGCINHGKELRSESRQPLKRCPECGSKGKNGASVTG